MTSSIVLFAASLTQNVFVVAGTNEGPGCITLLFGWMGLLVLNGPAFCWIANPLLFFAWWYFIRGKTSLSLILSSGATILAACFLLFDTIIVDEGGGSREITGYCVGYWLWLSAITIMMVGNILIYIFKKPVEGSVT
ncbi:MAG TPA: hypothetical protein VK668_02190 [Mucilaginibacter sp.]|nr:hypothetical protein [Mucilaginibacter sp.]